MQRKPDPSIDQMVRGFLHYALEVPEPTVGQRYYQDFGLVGAGETAEAIRLRAARQPRANVLLYAGPRKRLHHLCFAAPGEDLLRVREALSRAGVREEDPPRGAPEGGLWVRDPDGNRVNIRDEVPPPPPADPPLLLNGPGHAPRQAIRGCPERGQGAVPRRLGHVLLFSPDLGRQIRFYTEVLGLKLSDRSRDLIAFMRCSTDHHNVAVLASRGPGFHHGSFEVGSVDEISLGALRMADRGWQPGWGLGRHVIGSNFFYYIRDPWGSFVEYYFDLDYIPEACAWVPRDFPPEDSLYLWGPPVPPDFAENRELA
jgi:catechol 2,3-dioxygenase-like lactoylglutathione lyase family enzyme